MKRLFGFRENLITYYVLLILFLTLFYSLLSGPSADFLSIKEKLPGLNKLSRQARYVIVYHTLAVPFISLVATMIVFCLKPEKSESDLVIRPLFFGSVLSSISGLIYAYMSGGMIFHGLFIAGLSMVFYGGIRMLLMVLNLNKERFASNLEKTALILLIFSILVSSIIGGAIGAYFGTGFKATLAEDIIRKPHNVFERALISHLHIMVALVAAAVLYLLSRYFGYYKQKNSIFYFLFIAGVIVTSVSTWAVIVDFLEKKAHKVINVGAVLLIASSFVYGYHALKFFLSSRKNIFEAISVFHLFAVNLTVTLPGVYVAINLEKFRQPGFEALERAFAVGHWHLLAVTCALIISAIYFDIAGIQSWIFKFSAFVSHLLMTVAFVFANFYMFSLNKQFLTTIEVFLAPGFILLVLLFAVSIVTLFKNPERAMEAFCKDEVS